MRRAIFVLLVSLIASPGFAQKIFALRIGKLWDGEKVVDRPGL